jgi:hypothetical protein
MHGPYGLESHPHQDGKTPETSAHTSIKKRTTAVKSKQRQPKSLLPFVAIKHPSQKAARGGTGKDPTQLGLNYPTKQI